MPEYPNPKLRSAPPPAARGVTPCSLPYAELDVKTNFSFLRGASHPDELAYRAAELGYRAMAVTDVNSLAGVVRVHEAAKEVGLKLLIGSRLTFSDAPDLLVWATDRPAYACLCRLLTLGKRRTEKGECDLKLEDFLNENKGLLAGIDLEGSPSCLRACSTLPPRRPWRSPFCSCQLPIRKRRHLSSQPPRGTFQSHRHSPSGDQLGSLSRSRSARAAGCAHLRPPWMHDPRSGIPTVSQWRAISQIARSRCTACLRDYPGAIRRGLEIADDAHSSSIRCVMNIRMNWSPLGRTADRISVGTDLERGGGALPARHSRKGARACSTTSWQLIEQLKFRSVFSHGL